MKRYISGIVAVTIALAAVAFTTPKNTRPLSSFTFHYTPTSYGQSTVEANGNWVSGASLCGGNQNKACQMEVTDTYTHLDGSNRVLNTTGSVIIIKAVPGAGGTDYVPNPLTSTGIPSATNKP